jgi:hypothetical protein
MPPNRSGRSSREENSTVLTERNKGSAKGRRVLAKSDPKKALEARRQYQLATSGIPKARKVVRSPGPS